MVEIAVNGCERRVSEISFAMDDQEETLQPSNDTETDG
jgi:hypothetical protein